MIAANSVHAAPAGLAQTISAVALTKGAAASTSTLTLIKGTLKLMAWTKAKTAVATGAAVLLVAGTAVVTIFKATHSNSKGSNLAQTHPMLIVPGVSVGDLHRGMTTDEVTNECMKYFTQRPSFFAKNRYKSEKNTQNCKVFCAPRSKALLGQPDKGQGHVLIYDKNYGLSVVCGQKLGLQALFCGYPGDKKFQGRTKEGIGMGSSRDDVIKAFGHPTRDEPSELKHELLEYRNLGLNFLLYSGKVSNMIVDLRKWPQENAQNITP